MKRFMLAHAKSDDTARIEMMLKVANHALDRAAKGQPFAITTGRDYFESRFKAAGSWEAWTTEVATGLTYPAREPVFHGFLVPTERFGAGTARILDKALAAAKPCFLFRGDGAIARIIAVQHDNPGDWQTGHRATHGQFT